MANHSEILARREAAKQAKAKEAPLPPSSPPVPRRTRLFLALIASFSTARRAVREFFHRRAFGHIGEGVLLASLVALDEFLSKRSNEYRSLYAPPTKYGVGSLFYRRCSTALIAILAMEMWVGAQPILASPAPPPRPAPGPTQSAPSKEPAMDPHVQQIIDQSTNHSHKMPSVSLPNNEGGRVNSLFPDFTSSKPVQVAQVDPSKPSDTSTPNPPDNSNTQNPENSNGQQSNDSSSSDNPKPEQKTYDVPNYQQPDMGSHWGEINDIYSGKKTPADCANGSGSSSSGQRSGDDPSIRVDRDGHEEGEHGEHNGGHHKDQLARATANPEAAFPPFKYSRTTAPGDVFLESAANGSKFQAFTGDYTFCVANTFTNLARQEKISYSFYAPSSNASEGVIVNKNSQHAAATIEYLYEANNSLRTSSLGSSSAYRIKVYDELSPQGRQEFASNDARFRTQIKAAARVGLRGTGDWVCNTTRGGQLVSSDIITVSDQAPSMTGWHHKVNNQLKPLNPALTANRADEDLIYTASYPIPAYAGHGTQKFKVEWDLKSTSDTCFNQNYRRAFWSLSSTYTTDGSTWEIRTEVADSLYQHPILLQTSSGNSTKPTLDLSFGTGMPKYGTFTFTEKVSGSAAQTSTLTIHQIDAKVSRITPGYYQDATTPFVLSVQTFPATWNAGNLTWNLNIVDDASSSVLRQYTGTVDGNAANGVQWVQVFDGQSGGSPIPLGKTVHPEFSAGVPAPPDDPPYQVKLDLSNTGFKGYDFIVGSVDLAKDPTGASLVEEFEVTFDQSAPLNITAPTLPQTGSYHLVWTPSNGILEIEFNSPNPDLGFELTTTDLNSAGGQQIPYTGGGDPLSVPLTGTVTDLLTGQAFNITNPQPSDYSAFYDKTNTGLNGYTTELIGYRSGHFFDYLDGSSVPTTASFLDLLGPTVFNQQSQGSLMAIVKSTDPRRPPVTREWIASLWGKRFDTTPGTLLYDALAKDYGTGFRDVFRPDCECRSDCWTNFGKFLDQISPFSSPIPINYSNATGRFSHGFVDLAVATKGLPLVVSRSHNSEQQKVAPSFGWSWNFSQDFLIVEPNSGNVYHEEGSLAHHTFTKNGTDYVTDGDNTDRLVALDARHFQVAGKDHTRRIYEVPSATDITKGLPFRAVLKQEIDASGNANSFTWNAAGTRLLRMEGPDPSQFITLIWSDDRGPDKIFDQTARSVVYKYSDFERPQTCDGSAPSPDWVLAKVIQPGNKVYEHGYHKVLGERNYHLLTTTLNGVLQEKVVTSEVQPGVMEEVTHLEGPTMAYTRNGSTTTVTASAPSGMPENRDQTWTYTLDPDDRVVAGTDVQGRSGQLTLDPNHNIKEAVDAAGHQTSQTSDARNNPTSLTDQQGKTTIFKYDNNDNMISTQLPDGSTTTIEYDSNNRPVLVRDPLSHVSKISYTSFGAPAIVTDNLNHSWSFSYDSLGFLSGKTAPPAAPGQPQAQWTFVNDQLGRQVKSVDPLQRETRMTWDVRDRLVKTVIPAVTARHIQGSLAEGTVTANYDNNDLLLSSTALDGLVTAYTYSPAQRLLTVLPPGVKNPTKLQYNAMEAVTNVTNSNGATTSYVYDTLNRVVSKLYPGGSSEAFGFDLNSNLVSWNRGAYNVTYTYNNLDLLTNISSPATNDSIALDYDQLNRVKSMSDNSGSTTYAFNPNYTLQSVTHPGNKAFVYGYDSGDRLISQQDPEGLTTAYSYSDRNELSTVTHDGKTVTYVHDLLGLTRIVHMPNGVDTKLDYSERNQLLFKEYDKGANPLITLKYGFNQIGQRVAGQQIDATGTTRHAYGFNNRRELIASSVDGPRGQHSGVQYALDQNDNITNDNGVGFTSNTADQLTKVGSTALAYNGAGQATTWGDKSLTFNYRDQIKAITGPGLNAQYLYDGNGQRVQKTVNGVVQRFLWNGGSIAKEYRADGSVRADYQLGVGAKIEGNWQFYLSDIQGSTIGIADDQGKVIAQFSYSDYGVTTQTSGDKNLYQPFLYTHSELDAETGLYHNKARHYAAQYGKFLARDPIANSNLYSYCNGDPINYSDPSGLDIKVSPGLGGLLSLIAGLDPTAASMMQQLSDSTNFTWEVRVGNYGAAALGGHKAATRKFFIGNGAKTFVNTSAINSNTCAGARAYFIASLTAELAQSFAISQGYVVKGTVDDEVQEFKANVLALKVLNADPDSKAYVDQHLSSFFASDMARQLWNGVEGGKTESDLWKIFDPAYKAAMNKN